MSYETLWFIRGAVFFMALWACVLVTANIVVDRIELRRHTRKEEWAMQKPIDWKKISEVEKNVPLREALMIASLERLRRLARRLRKEE
jgi:hypothetical protein